MNITSRKTTRSVVGVASGAGAGMIAGAVFGNPGVGLVLGAAVGLVAGAAMTRFNGSDSA